MPARGQSDPDAFRIVLLPDTQKYTADPGLFAHFLNQTVWIAAERLAERIVFVSHVGDVVEGGAADLEEWGRGDRAMDVLDGDLVADPEGILPYSVTLGNHDCDTVGDKGSTQVFSDYFGSARYAGRSWFVGADVHDRNTSQIFTVDGQEYLHLGLEWRPSDEALLWAMGVLDARPDLPVIVSTHEHLRSGNPANRSHYGATPDATGDNSGKDVFHKLIVPYPQIFLVLSGHFAANGRRASTTLLGRELDEMLADYQDDPNGGNGWMQILEFRPSAAEIESIAFSPTYVPGTTEGPNHAESAAANFVIESDFALVRSDLASRITLHLRNGQDAGFGPYAGTHDTYLGDGTHGETLPDVEHGERDDVWSDGDGDHDQGLIRFEGIVGDGPGQVPPGTTIERAILSVTTEGMSSSSFTGATLHRMTIAWDESLTWNSAGAGIQLGSEARSEADALVTNEVSEKGTDTFDVTASVQAWVDGEPNWGWLVQAGGHDRWSFRSSEWLGIVERPVLTVRFGDPCVASLAYCPAATNSTGQRAELAHEGSVSLAANDLTLVATKAVPHQAGVFFFGDSRDALPLGNGTLCVGGPLQRILPATQLDANGAASVELDLGALPFDANTTWNFQFWFRDPPAGGAGSDTSNGLEIRFCE
ncbi:MAG: DNRLRE domain-containing protein [bacterium]|nr:DNRLRE domain-containing protein [bacterium]